MVTPFSSLTNKVVRNILNCILSTFSVCFRAILAETETDAIDTEPLQVATSASQTDEDVTVVDPLEIAATTRQADEDIAAREQLLHACMGEMIYQFLAHTTDIKRGNLTDKLAAKNVLSSGEKQKIEKQKKTDTKVQLQTMLLILREKSGDRFESFLTTLAALGQQSVVDVVHQALHTIGQTGQNPLQYTYG